MLNPPTCGQRRRNVLYAALAAVKRARVYLPGEDFPQDGFREHASKMNAVLYLFPERRYITGAEVRAAEVE